MLLALAFPEGGFQPFVPSAFYPALACVLAVAALIPGDGRAGTRALRAGALLYAAAMIGAYVLKTPAGGNVDRLGALVTGPVAACALAAGARARLRWPWRRRALLVLAPLLLYWQANAPVTDFASAAADPSVHASYYSPLLAELTRLGIGNGASPARIEVVPTADHWEARFIAPHVAIARGWERQLDNVRNALFYRGRLDAARLRAWLHDEAISYIALPDAPLDYSARAEARLLRHDRPPYLREVWRSMHWRLFAVLGTAPAASRCACATRPTGVWQPAPAASRTRQATGPRCARATPGPCAWSSRSRSRVCGSTARAAAEQRRRSSSSRLSRDGSSRSSDAGACPAAGMA